MQILNIWTLVAMATQNISSACVKSDGTMQRRLAKQKEVKCYISHQILISWNRDGLTANSSLARRFLIRYPSLFCIKLKAQIANVIWNIDTLFAQNYEKVDLFFTF